MSWHEVLFWNFNHYMKQVVSDSSMPNTVQRATGATIQHPEHEAMCTNSGSFRGGVHRLNTHFAPPPLDQFLNADGLTSNTQNMKLRATGADTQYPEHKATCTKGWHPALRAQSYVYQGTFHCFISTEQPYRSVWTTHKPHHPASSPVPRLLLPAVFDVNNIRRKPWDILLGSGVRQTGGRLTGSGGVNKQNKPCERGYRWFPNQCCLMLYSTVDREIFA